MKKASTPFLHDSGDFGPARNPTDEMGVPCEWCGFVVPDEKAQVGGDSGSLPAEFTQAAVDFTETDDDRGQLADSASSVLMKILYAARMARFDLLRAVQGLAKHFTKWKKRHDQELYRLVCYIWTTKHKKMIGWVGDDIADIQPHLFSDSDFAGSEGTQRSTS